MERLKRDLMMFLRTHKKRMPFIAAGCCVLLIYAISRACDREIRIYQTEGKPDFKDARVLGNDTISEGRDKLLSKTLKDVLTGQNELRELTQALKARVEEMEKPKPDAAQQDPAKASEQAGKEPNDKSQQTPVRFHEPYEGGEAKRFPNEGGESMGVGNPGLRRRFRASGPQVISFPVKDSIVEKGAGIVIPPGSYVKAKLMTGVEAPEGKTYPVLLQLDYAYIIPNHKRLDLSGCFMIAKSQGDLSTERVQMQASKLSCVSRDGKMFERDVNGFVADDKDNSFAVVGSVNSKQDRVASMAFLSSIVEGVGKAIQHAQTTQQVNPLGGSSSVVTGDQMAYLGAGGAANAAGLVTQWYLKQAQNLLPTINVGSGQDVWVVMQEKVPLPNEYFRKTSKGGDGDYSYLSRILD